MREARRLGLQVIDRCNLTGVLRCCGCNCCGVLFWQQVLLWIQPRWCAAVVPAGQRLFPLPPPPPALLCSAAAADVPRLWLWAWWSAAGAGAGGRFALVNRPTRPHCAQRCWSRGRRTRCSSWPTTKCGWWPRCPATARVSGRVMGWAVCLCVCGLMMWQGGPAVQGCVPRCTSPLGVRAAAPLSCGIAAPL